jgi:uncharacterized protein
LRAKRSNPEPRDGCARADHDITISDKEMGCRYFQRRVDGVPISALVLAGGRRAIVLGFSSQWSSPSRAHAFRYGGAMRPAPLSPGIADALAAAVQRLFAQIPLVGLNSVDFLVADGAFHVLEINPRPGATLDIFEPPGTSLFALHVDACRGVLPEVLPAFDGAAANATVYADAEITTMPAYEWPSWAADRQTRGTCVTADAPLCTVTARAATVAEARRLVAERAARVLAELARAS